MKALWLLCAAGTAIAAPRHPDRYAAAASVEFDKATAEESKGHLLDALGHYEKAFEISPHPDVVFNEASVLERMNRDHEAIAAYQLYLLLAPQATDRKQVEAAIDRIATKTRTFDVKIDDMNLGDAYVLLDGELLAKPGQIKDNTMKITLGPGHHFFSAITGVTFVAEETSARSILEHGGAFVSRAKPRVDGNLVIEMPYRHSVRVGDRSIGAEQRVVIAGGAQMLAVRDGIHECPFVKIEAPKDDSIAYVALLDAEFPEEPAADVLDYRCRKLVVKQHHLVFPK